MTIAENNSAQGLKIKALESLAHVFESKSLFTDDFIDNGNFFFAILDSKYRLLKINNIASSLLGIQKADSVGEIIFDYIVDTEMLAALAKFSADTTTNITSNPTTFEGVFSNPDGTKIYFSFSLQLISETLNAGEPIFFLVGTDVTNMKNMLLEQIAREKLERQHQVLKKELATAASIQKMLIPGPEAKIGVNENIAIFYRPSEYCSGDFWYYKTQGDHRLLVMCDVQGHGVASGMLGSFINGYIHSRMSNYFGITEDILRNLGDKIFELTGGEYSTTFSAVEINEREVALWNSGGTFPMVVDSAGNMNTVKMRSNVLGLGDFYVQSAVFEKSSIQRILWHTDGFGDFYNGNHRISVREIKQINASIAMLKLIEIEDRLKAYLKEVEKNYRIVDDITYTVIDV